MKKLVRHFSGTCYPLSRRGSSIIDDTHREGEERDSRGGWSLWIGRGRWAEKDKRKVDKGEGGYRTCLLLSVSAFSKCVACIKLYVLQKLFWWVSLNSSMFFSLAFLWILPLQQTLHSQFDLISFLLYLFIVLRAVFMFGLKANYFKM